MTIISVVICSKSGKITLARQYQPITKARLEGLFFTFPKLIDKNQQHTYVETDAHRYVYMLLGETQYLVLLTDKRSNIIQDISLLRKLFTLTQNVTRNNFELRRIVESSFELFFTYDESISSLGHPESLAIDQVDSILKMESHEESLQDMLTQNAIQRASDIAKQREAEIHARLKETDGIRVGGIGSASAMQRSGINVQVFNNEEEDFYSRYPPDRRDRESHETSSSSRGVSPSSSLSSTRKKQTRPSQKALPKGMSLGGARRGKVKDTLLTELGIDEPEEEEIESPTQESGQPGEDPKNEAGKKRKKKKDGPGVDGVKLGIFETVNIEIDNNEENTNIVVKGHLTVEISSAEYKQSFIQMEGVDDKLYKFNTHPQMNRKKFQNEKILMANKGFQPGKSFKVMQWRSKKKDNEDLLPLTLTCWPNDGEDGWSVAVDFEVKNTNAGICDLKIRIPLPKSGEVNVESYEVGNYKIQKSGAKRFLLWYIPMDPEKGSMEFSVDEGTEESFFPIQTKFRTLGSISGLNVAGVTGKDGNKVAFEKDVDVNVESYALMMN